MALGSAGVRVWVALVAFLCATAPAVAGETYFSLDRMKIPFQTGETFHRVLVVDLDLAVGTPEDKERVRAVRHVIKSEIEKALGAKPVSDFEAGNLAVIVKRIARAAAQRAAGDEIRIADALIRSARLI